MSVRAIEERDARSSPAHEAAPAGPFFERFLHIVESYPDSVCFENPALGVRVTYAALAAETGSALARLRELGVHSGERVALALPNGLSFIANYLGLIALGAEPVLVNPHCSQREILEMVCTADPVALLTTDEVWTRLGRKLFSSRLRVVALTDGSAGTDDRRVVALSSLPACDTPLAPPTGNPIAAIVFTYKGMGRPLGVAHRYHALMASADGIHARLPRQTPGSTHLVVLPFTAVFGLVCALLLPLSSGGRILQVDRLAAESIPALLARERVRLFSLVPDVVRMLLARADSARNGALESLDPELTLLSGGSYLEPELAERCGHMLGLPPVLQGYGTSECLPVTVQNFHGPRQRGSLGRPIDIVKLRVQNAFGEVAARGEPGELFVSGQTVASGFTGDEEASRLFFDQGWFRTGDIVYLDDQGELHFLGRRLRITKINGSMVDLAEIERVACLHEAIVRARARVRRTAQGRNALLLDAETTTAVDLREVNAHLREHLSQHKVPRRIQLSRCAS